MMRPLSNSLGIALFLLASPSSIHSFSSVALTSRACRSPILHQPLIIRSMSDTETSEETTAESTDVEPPAEETQEPKEDPAVTELKQTIAKLELEIKSKRSNLQNLQDMADRYSSAGYARQVAMVENNKRMRGENVADTKFAARAGVIQTFLPVLDDLDALGARYEGDSFASSLGALRTEFFNSLQELGVTEFGAKAGEAVDGSRVVAVGEEHSDEFSEGTVISLLKSGFEIQGNIVRAAECVGSLGPEKVEEASSPAADETNAKEEDVSE
ncbi:hypothetical protein HJC23_000451 [Cyclotella cryptica]|uniref:GrpE protein homolog n=1 Tax=Cyclotella cryptica TaxID=29204 RepID=A0ABD3QAK2_9STRA|eukprot:CCRYP_007198-RA/>CCRYP_007198-RA protein AED:0.16 eAED:0.16 QI:0/-1/0/1/-1/1/1/0/270